MNSQPKWKELGWRHPLWELLRFYLSLRGKNERDAWLEQLEMTGMLSVDDHDAFQLAPETVDDFLEYLPQRDRDFDACFGNLRTEKQALAFCKKNRIPVKNTATKNKDHHQSSKAMVATVTKIAETVCDRLGKDVDPNPQRRCVWCLDNGLHVSARNIDGAIPSLANPKIIWEIKEYWGTTSGGSKMSDAVYECNLVGRELREFEDRSGFKAAHVVFVDGLAQWTVRKSDLKRFIDLTNQGLIDHLIVGRDVETEWEQVLGTLLADP